MKLYTFYYSKSGDIREFVTYDRDIETPELNVVNYLNKVETNKRYKEKVIRNIKWRINNGWKYSIFNW